MIGKRINREYKTQLNAPPKEAFPLLCPVREYEWIPQWQCEIIYTETGVAELGCVFSTQFGDDYGKEIWVVSHYQPDVKIGFVRIGRVRATRYEVELEASKNGSTITWRQEITSLDDRGTPLLETFSDAKYRAIMKPLNKMLDHYLQHGSPLEVDISNAYTSKTKGNTDESDGR